MKDSVNGGFNRGVKHTDAKPGRVVWSGTKIGCGDSLVRSFARSLLGYIPDAASPLGWKNNVFKHVIKGGPAGGGFSTVGDLHRFARALQSGKLVSEKSLKRMWSDHGSSNYGYGFSLERRTAGFVTGHGGGFPGLNGQLDIYVDRGYIVAVLANYGGAASPVAGRIKQLISRIKQAKKTSTRDSG